MPYRVASKSYPTLQATSGVEPVGPKPTPKRIGAQTKAQCAAPLLQGA